MRQSWIVISICTIVAGCFSPDIEPNSVKVLGHGGSGFVTLNNHLPANSEASVKRAIEIQGADGIEVDIQVTKDNEVVLFHDNRLETSTTDTGFISALYLEDVKKLTYKTSGTAYTGTHGVWTLEEMIDYLNSLNNPTYISLNIHPQQEWTESNYDSLFIKSIDRTLENYLHKDRVFVESPEFNQLFLGRDLFKHSYKLMLVGQMNSDNISTITANNLTGFVTHFLDESESSVSAARNEGLTVVFYGLKIRQDIPRALRLKPDYVQTDNIPLTLSYLNR